MTNGTTTTRKTRNSPQKTNGPGRNYVVIKHFEPSVKSVKPGNDKQSPIPLVNAENDKPTNNAKLGPSKPQRKPPPTNTTTVQGVTAKSTKKVWKPALKSSSSSSLESKLQKFTNKYTVRSRSFHAGASQDLKSSRNLKSATDPKLVHLDSLKQEILENKLQQKSVGYAGSLKNLKPVEDLKAEIYQTRSSNMQHKKMLITELRSEIAQYKQFSSFQVYNSYERPDVRTEKKLEIENAPGSSESEVSSIRPGTVDSTKRSSESSLDKTELSNLIGCSIADSASDDLIKNKIREANLLIERVKTALNKIKAIKTHDSQVKSSDIEETGQNLKQPTEEHVEEVKPEFCKQDMKESVSRKVCGSGSIKRYQGKTRVTKLERPKTRRNEADEDITEDVAKNKFRNVPEERHLDKSGSLIELQTKLQTISETTESDHSIPRKNSLITTALYKIDKEVQATPCVRSVGICPDYSRDTKQVQTSPVVHSKNVMTENEDFSIQLSSKPLKRCQIECLPILEVLPAPDACICQKCRTVLTKENLTGLSICSKPDKLQKLAVQVLPPVVIPESMTLTPVLHLSISPSGHTENHVKNSKNIAFVSDSHNFEFVEEKPKTGDVNIAFSDERLINEEDEEQKKLLWCKSYQIYDNPNNHDPGELDKESMEKISHLDVDFYRTFINPVLSETRLGLVSKSTQCDWDDQDLESLVPPPLRPKKINFSLVGDSENTSIMGGRSITSNMESTITVLKLNPNLTDDVDEDILNPFESQFVLRGSYEENHQDDSSPSSITVTMSYSLSSDEKSDSLNKPSKSSDAQISDEVQLKVTNFEIVKDEKLLTAKDTTTIKQIRDKLQSLDATGGENDYHQFLDSGLNLKKPDLKNPTVNYVLSGSSARHLELGPNGRYKDEEHLFSQTAGPNRTFEHRDVEIAGDKLFKLPPRRRRLDTSNSDTVTTNSQLSEGELLCRHSLSNGELHQCHYRPFKRRNILTKTSKAVRKRPSKKIDFKDPSVTVELRRNYFNNWVTYYVKPQDVYESTISGSNTSTVNSPQG